MATCGGCHRNLADTAVRCMYCGASKAPPKECPRCMRKLDPQAIRCVFCNVAFGPVAHSGPDPRAIALARGELFQHAERLRKANQPVAALEILDQVVLADPRYLPGWLARGKCFALAGNALGARDSARAALAIDPEHAEARQLHEIWAKAAGAMAPLALAAAATSVENAAREANRLLESGRHADALVLFDELAASIMPDRRDAPELAALHTARGVALQTMRRLPEALASFAEALRVNPRYALAWQNQASALDDAGRVKEAALSAERAVELDSARANAWVDLGYYRKKLGQPRQALDAYEQALAIDPGHPAALLNAGNVLAEQGRIDEAERAYRGALATSPDFAHAKAALERLAAARQRAAKSPSSHGAPAGLPAGRPHKSALERASSNAPADRFFTHALLALRSGEIPSAKMILAVGWITAVPDLPGAELLTDVIVEGRRAYACRTAGGAPAASVETIGRVDLFAARELLVAGVFDEVVWVLDAEPSEELRRALDDAADAIGRAGGMRVLRIPPA